MSNAQAEHRLVWSVARSTAMAFGAAFVMTVLYPTYVALLSSLVLVAHEAGHYLAAWLRDADPVPPYFVPLVVGILGITRVRKLPQLSKRARRYIIWAGPLTGLVVALSLAPFAALVNPVYLWTLGVCVSFEIYSATFGSDGKKWRKDRR